MNSVFSIKRDLFISTVCNIIDVDEEEMLTSTDLVDRVQSYTDLADRFVLVLATLNLVNNGKTEELFRFFAGVENQLGAMWATMLQLQHPGED